MKKIRKPIQIAALRFEKPSAIAGEPGSIETEVVALCDDGSIWTILGNDNEWVPLPPIPQDQLREDWLAAVGEELVSGFLVQRNAISGILEEYRQELRLAFNSHESAKDAAKAVNAKLQAHR
ncbi:hypothetical protein [Massilia aerilata]|uniref:Uncharacterized protein n=1 Tax=Massilia aerilata TaxID=453817 RepID=A0ABW0S1C9_9BURK